MYRKRTINGDELFNADIITRPEMADKSAPTSVRVILLISINILFRPNAITNKRYPSLKDRFKIIEGFQDLNMLLKPLYESEKQHSAYGNDNKTSIRYEQC